jgi:SAM-dependent methyltransferase
MDSGRRLGASRAHACITAHSSGEDQFSIGAHFFDLNANEVRKELLDGITQPDNDSSSDIHHTIWAGSVKPMDFASASPPRRRNWPMLTPAFNAGPLLSRSVCLASVMSRHALLQRDHRLPWPVMSTDNWLADTRTSYDTVAVNYADLVRNALSELQYLRSALTLFANGVLAAGGGPVADVGCGPGHITAHLHELGLDAFGVDLSPGMIAVARHDHPHLRFEVSSMTNLSLPASSLAGLLAWQSLIHIPDEDVPTVFEHFHRSLRPGGLLQLLFHTGDTSRLKTEGYGGHPMKVYVHRRQPDKVAGWLRDTGFEVEAQLLLNNPDGGVSQAVLFARREVGE